MDVWKDEGRKDFVPSVVPFVSLEFTPVYFHADIHFGVTFCSIKADERTCRGEVVKQATLRRVEHPHVTIIVERIDFANDTNCFDRVGSNSGDFVDYFKLHHDCVSFAFLILVI